jgi:hypothetical protein
MAESTTAVAPSLTDRFERAFMLACEVHDTQLRESAHSLPGAPDAGRGAGAKVRRRRGRRDWPSAA